MSTTPFLVIASIVTAAVAGPESIGLSTDAIGDIYYNIATGEVIRIGPGQARNGGDPVWVNEGYDQCAFGEWYYTPLHDDAQGTDTHWADWGDVDSNSVVDCMTFLYFTTVEDAEGDGEAGFEMDVSFFDGVDAAELAAPEATDNLYLTYTITDIPGSASGGGSAWLITIDLSGGGEFEVGDSDGVDASGNGFISGGLGVDVDGDGLSDFAYGFNFRHPEGAVAFSGPGLAGPSPETAPGDVDSAALFDGSWDNFTGFFDFGGHECTEPGFQWVPWASAYIGLYRNNVIVDCFVDLNQDGSLDFFDIQIWLGWFSAHDPRADMNNDGVFDFFDVQIFLGLFSAGCP
jgi:hypothetical protein